MRTRYAAPALLAAALLGTGCSSGSSTAAKASFIPPATTASPASSPASTGATASPSAPVTASAPGAPSTPAASVPTSAPVATTSVPPTTSPAAPSGVARLVDRGTVSMAGRKATLTYAAVVTSDSEKNAVLTAFGDFERTVMIAFDSHSPTLPLIAQFTAGQQQQTLIATVDQRTANHQGSRGVLRYWKATVTEVRTTTLGRVATVTSCGNESKWIGVNELTGKAVPNDPDDKFSYLQTTSLLNTGDGHWRVSLVAPVDHHAKACP